MRLLSIALLAIALLSFGSPVEAGCIQEEGCIPTPNPEPSLAFQVYLPLVPYAAIQSEGD